MAVGEHPRTLISHYRTCAPQLVLNCDAPLPQSVAKAALKPKSGSAIQRSVFARISTKTELHEVRQSELRGQPQQTIHDETDHKIGQAAPIQKKSLVPKSLREVRNQRKIVNCVTQKNGYGVFNPSPKRNSQKFAFHKHRVVGRQLTHKYRVA